MKSDELFTKTEKKKLTLIVGLFFLCIGSWQLIRSWDISIVLASNQKVTGIVITKPECSISSRRSQFCDVRIASFNKEAHVEITGSICDTLKVGDELVLKHTNDRDHFYVDDKFYKQSANYTLILYALITLLGLTLIANYRKKRKVENEQ